MIALWGAKSGEGCTTTAIGVSSAYARSNPSLGTLLVDLGGDLPAALGSGSRDGCTEWLASTGSPLEALRNLELPTALNGLRLLPMGQETEWPDTRQQTLLQYLLALDRNVVVDVGGLDPTRADSISKIRQLFAAQSGSILVTRACFLALSRLQAVGLVPQRAVLMREEGRALTASDVGRIVDCPIVGEIDVEPRIRRALDAGLLLTRAPMLFRRQCAALLS